MSNRTTPASIPRPASPATLLTVILLLLLVGPALACSAATAQAGGPVAAGAAGDAAAPAGAASAAPEDGPGIASTPSRARPELPADRPLRVAFLVVDGVYNSELMAPYDVFHHTPFHSAPAPGMAVFTVSPDGEPVRTFEGLRIQPDYGFADAPQADVLVVPSAEGSMGPDLDDEVLIGWVRATGERARWVVSLCDGAFVLAQAGLLDGHAVTTFPADYDELAARFPALDLRINVSFVHHGKVLTSQGGARSYDVAMYLVDLLYGPEVAHGVGEGLLIPWPPDHDSEPAYTVVIDPRQEGATE